MYCKHCGRQVDDNAKFCQHCGKSIAEDLAANVNPQEVVEQAPTKKKKAKKSIFKRWWFWLLVIIFLFVSCTGTSEPSVTHPDVSEAQYKGMCEVIEFDQLARNPDNYKDKMFKFTGEVIQVMEGSGYVEIRLNVTKVSSEGSDWVYYEDTIYAKITMEDGADRILEEDIITIYGVCSGSYSYKSVLGSQVTLPRMEVLYYEIG